MENAGIAPHTLNLSTIWQLAVSFIPRMLCHVGKNKRYQLLCGRQVSQPHSWSINCTEMNISCPWWDLNSNYLNLQASQDCDNYCGAQFEQHNVTSNHEIQNVGKMFVMKHTSFVCECLHTPHNIHIT